LNLAEGFGLRFGERESEAEAERLVFEISRLGFGYPNQQLL
jgi:hypothetical protein